MMHARATPAWRSAWARAGAVSLGAWLVARVGELAITALSSPPSNLPHLFAHWQQWDARWYLAIAAWGYGTPAQPVPPGLATLSVHGHTAAAFFPLYPALIHLVATLLGGQAWLAAGLLVSNLATLAGTVLLYQLAAENGRHGNGLWAVLLLTAFPTALFLTAPYSEGVFLAASAGYLLCVQRGWWSGAALCGVLAGLGRPLGVALAVVGGLAVWEGWRQRRAVWGALSAAMAPAVGLALYMAFLWVRFGAPLAFSSAQRAWHRAWVWPWQALWLGVTRPLATWPHLSGTNQHALSDAAFVLAMLGMSGLVWCLLPLAQRLYLAAFWALTLSNAAVLDGYPAPLSSLPRFCLLAVPLYVGMARLRPWARWTWLAGSIIYLCFNSLVFVHGNWVA